MFFFLSKVLDFILNPLFWVLLFVILAFFGRKDSKKIKNRLIISFSIFVFFTNGFISDLPLKIIETDMLKKQELDSNYSAIILLGGGMATYDNAYDRIIFRGTNTDRVFQTIELYNNDYTDKIIISSGAGSLINKEIIESKIIRDYFVSIGIDSNDILTEDKSNNTYQNALYTKDIIDNNFENGNFLLITSSSHMYRAKKCFEKQGVNIDIYPVNKRTGNAKHGMDYYFLPSSAALNSWEIFFHECIGIVTYKIKGYI